MDSTSQYPASGCPGRFYDACQDVSSQPGPSRLPYTAEVQPSAEQQIGGRARSRSRRVRPITSSIFRGARAKAALLAASTLAVASLQQASALSLSAVNARSLSTLQHPASRSSKRDGTVVVGKYQGANDGPAVVKVVTVMGDADTSEQKALNDTVLPPSGRWGQTATYLPNEHLVLFVGGQVSNGKNVTLTNDVFALNVSAISSNFTAGATEPWQQLPSDGLAPHAFAANAVVSNDGSDQLWLFGGYVNNCSDASAWTWSPSGGVNSTWSAADTGAPAHSRKARATAMKVPASLPGSGAAASSTNGTSYMMLGGESASAACAAQSQAAVRRAASGVTADLWSFPQVTTTDASDRKTVNLQSLPVDASRGEFSLVDYSTVTLPANASSSNQDQTTGKTMFLGGLTASNQYAPWDHFWVFDPWTWTWVKWSTQGEVPSGRKGHSSTLLKDGRVLVVGGMLEDGSLSNEAFLLDPRTQPATWSKVSYADAEGDMSAPAKAYHSAILVDDVLLMGFGAAENTPSAGQTAVNSKQAALGQSMVTSEDSAAVTPTPASSSLYYLDMSNPSGWKWSDSLEGLAQNRGIVSSAGWPTSAGAAAAAAGQAAAAAAVDGAQGAVDGANSAAQGAVDGANSAAQGSQGGADSAAQGAIDGANAAAAAGVAAGQAATNAANGAAAAAAGEGSSGSAAPGDASDTDAAAEDAANAASSSPNGAPVAAAAAANKAGGQQSAISSDDGAASSSPDASTVAGAGDGSDGGDSGGSSQGHSGAIVGSVLGAAALAAAVAGLYVYKKRRDAREEGMYRHSMSSADPEKHSGAGAPPVSMLWFNNLKRKNTRGQMTQGDVDDSSFTRPADGGFAVARNLPKRPRASKVSTPFIESLVRDDDDDEGERDAFGNRIIRPIPVAGRVAQRDRYLDLDQTPAASPTGMANGAMFLGAPQGHQHLHRLSSCESLGSEGNESHTSYPYLSAMHRPSYGQGMNGTPMSGNSESMFMSTGANNTPQVPNESPRTRMMQERVRQGSYSNAAMAATWSPEVAELRSAALAVLTPQFGRDSMDGRDSGETMRAAGGDDDDDTATHYAVRGDDGASTIAGVDNAAATATATTTTSGLRRHSTNSPTVYPWSSAKPLSGRVVSGAAGGVEAYRSPAGARGYKGTGPTGSRIVSMPVSSSGAADTPMMANSSRRSRRSELRVMNRGQGEIVEESDA